MAAIFRQGEHAGIALVEFEGHALGRRSAVFVTEHLVLAPLIGFCPDAERRSASATTVTDTAATR